ELDHPPPGDVPSVPHGGSIGWCKAGPTRQIFFEPHRYNLTSCKVSHERKANGSSYQVPVPRMGRWSVARRESCRLRPNSRQPALHPPSVRQGQSAQAQDCGPKRRPTLHPLRESLTQTSPAAGRTPVRTSLPAAPTTRECSTSARFSDPTLRRLRTPRSPVRRSSKAGVHNPPPTPSRPLRCRYRTRTCLSCFPYGCRGNQESVSLFYLLIKKSPRRNQERLGLFGVSDRRRCQPTTTEPLSTRSPRPVRSSLAAGKARRTRRSPR